MISTIYSDRFVTMTMVNNKEEALEPLKEIENKAKIVWEKKNEIDISKTLQKRFVSVMDVYNYLPKTNEKVCGEQTCMVFALKLSASYFSF